MLLLALQSIIFCLFIVTVLFELLKDLTFLQHKKLSFLDSNLFFQKGVGFKLNVDSNPF